MNVHVPIAHFHQTTFYIPCLSHFWPLTHLSIQSSGHWFSDAFQNMLHILLHCTRTHFGMQIINQSSVFIYMFSCTSYHVMYKQYVNILLNSWQSCPTMWPKQLSRPRMFPLSESIPSCPSQTSHVPFSQSQSYFLYFLTMESSYLF